MGGDRGARNRVGCGGRYWFRPNRRTPPRRRPKGRRSIRLPYLPLTNSAGDPNLDYLSEGIAEHVITRLSNTPRLRVIARDSAFRYRGAEVDAVRVGHDLGVRAVLEGTIAQRDQVLSVSARLIDTRNGRQVWQDRYERGVTDLQQLQTELAQDIAGSLRLRLSDAQQARFAVRYTPSAEAYQLYLKGRYFWNRRTPADLQKSISYFQRATELDPQFAMAFSGLADSHGVLTEYHAADAVTTYAPARRAADRALAIDPQLAEAHTSLAYLRQFYQWDFAGAEREFRRAIELNPRYPTARQWFAETSPPWAASTKPSPRSGWQLRSIPCRSSSTAVRPTFSIWRGGMTRASSSAGVYRHGAELRGSRGLSQAGVPIRRAGTGNQCRCGSAGGRF